ncbi:MAG: hypothetical protein HOV76_08970 [Hamadaea sp.]|nr:hypothetical protein [Hamadaea sp.]
MPEAFTDARLARIADKLAVARVMTVRPTPFGSDVHKFELRPPLPETVVTEFEERHEIELPSGYRLFVTDLGDGGAGPGYRMRPLRDTCDGRCRPGHLARSSPYLPGPRYYGDWEQRHEDPPGPHRVFLPGTLWLADHGCTLHTQLIVTGPSRGRLFNLDVDGPVGPYVVEDQDFLAWYERWLDEAMTGYDVGWFGERLPLTEAELLQVLAADAAPHRRIRAGESLLLLPAVSDRAWHALEHAARFDDDPVVRSALWEVLDSTRPFDPPKIVPIPPSAVDASAPEPTQFRHDPWAADPWAD